MVFFITFGQNHFGPGPTVQKLKDHWIKIYVDLYISKLSSMTYPRNDRMQKNVATMMLGKKFPNMPWSMIYSLQEFDPSFFPKGCYAVIGEPSDEEIFEERLKAIYEQRIKNGV